MLDVNKDADRAGKKVLVRVLRVLRHGDRWLQPGDEAEYDYVTARGLEHAGKAVIVPAESGFVADADVPPDQVVNAQPHKGERARKEK